MDDDFGLLVDYLRGELEEPAATAARARLVAEGPLFDRFVLLRRTFALLRTMPAIAAGEGPREAYLADLQREFDARGWLELLPAVSPSPAMISMLRAEYAVRALLASVPMLQPGPAMLAALRAQFGVRAVVASLPQAQVRVQWVRALRQEFVVRALAAGVPQLEPSAAFARRVKLALYESAPQPVQAAPLLPTVDAADSFRRRLFKSILLSSRRSIAGPHKHVDVREYQLGRQFVGFWRRARRSVSVTMALHLIAIAALLFVTASRQSATHSGQVLAVTGEHGISPLQPPGQRGPAQTLPQIRRVPAATETELPRIVDAGGPGDASVEAPPAPLLEEEAAPVPPRHSDQALAIAARTDTAAWFRLRPEGRSAKIAYLGNEALYDALQASLLWLRGAQRQAGYWEHEDVREQPHDEGMRTIQRVELTSAALLAFLGDGHTCVSSPLRFDHNVRFGLEWLLQQQQFDGRIGAPGLPIVMGHAMATLVLAEEFGQTRAANLREPLRKASEWLCQVEAISEDADRPGGFPYREGQRASLLTSVWAHMALATAGQVGVPGHAARQERIQALLGWFQTLTRGELPLTDLSGEVLATSDLLPASGAASLALLARQGGLEARPEGHVARMLREPPKLEVAGGDAADMRYLFFGSLAFALSGQGADSGAAWTSAMHETLLANQVKEPRKQGSFDATSRYASVYGRVFSTAMAALAIENAWRVRVK